MLFRSHKRLAKYVTPTMSEAKLLRLNKTERDFSCPECGSKKFIKYGTYAYKKQDYQRYMCKGCSKVVMPEKDQ